MAKRILILGSHGMLGQDLVKVFDRDPSWDVFAYDRDEIDITSEKSLREKIENIEPQAVVNATGYNAVDKCETDEIEYELAKKINGYGPGILAKIGKEKNIPVVNYSTDYVFDGEKGEYNENDKPVPISNYGRSKLLARRKSKKTRTNSISSALQNFSAGPENLAMSKRSFFDTMIAACERQQDIKSR